MTFSNNNGSVPRVSSLRAVLRIGIALLVLQFLAAAQATEDQVKAAYLLNFAKLGEWPSRALPDGPSPLVIGVSGGDDEFLNVLKAAVAGKIVGSHLLVVKSVSSQSELKSSHIVFFRSSERKHIQAAIESLTQTGVLLVGEDQEFLQQGGMINLVLDHGSIRFEVNSDTLDRSEIHFSSKILALAKAGYGPSRASVSSAPVEVARPLQRNTPPEYPEIAKRMNLTGTVQVQAWVKPDGTVRDVKVLGGHPLLADALARAVRQWKYQPTAKETVEVVRFSFTSP